MQPEQILREHLRLCENVYDLLMRENHQMKSQGSPPSPEILEEKQELLLLLDHSLSSLKTLRREDFSPFGDGSKLMQKAQNKTLQIFYIDRENEQLLSKVALENAADVGFGSKER